MQIIVVKVIDFVVFFKWQSNYNIGPTLYLPFWILVHLIVIEWKIALSLSYSHHHYNLEI